MGDLAIFRKKSTAVYHHLGRLMRKQNRYISKNEICNLQLATGPTMIFYFLQKVREIQRNPKFRMTTFPRSDFNFDDRFELLVKFYARMDEPLFFLRREAARPWEPVAQLACDLH